MKFTSLFFCFFFYCACYCQKKDVLSVEVAKVGYAQDSSIIYGISITNFSDSIICILHSHFILLSAGNSPQALAVTENEGKRESYLLTQSARDTLFAFEIPQYRASIILPYQMLNFKIQVAGSQKEQFLSIEYFQIFDMCYRKFKNEMLIGRWYQKYHLLNKSVELPKL